MIPIKYKNNLIAINQSCSMTTAYNYLLKRMITIIRLHPPFLRHQFERGSDYALLNAVTFSYFLKQQKVLLPMDQCGMAGWLLTSSSSTNIHGRFIRPPFNGYAFPVVVIIMLSFMARHSVFCFSVEGIFLVCCCFLFHA